MEQRKPNHDRRLIQALKSIEEGCSRSLPLYVSFAFRLVHEREEMVVFRVATLGCLCAVVLLLTGCDAGGAASKVKVTVTSAKVKFAEADSIGVTFVPQGQGEAAVASGSANKFPLEAMRSDSDGVAPGKYTIGIAVTPYPGSASPAHAKELEEINRKYQQSDSPLQYEVTSDPEQSITIDLDAGTVTKS